MDVQVLTGWVSAYSTHPILVTNVSRFVPGPCFSEDDRLPCFSCGSLASLSGETSPSLPSAVLSEIDQLIAMKKGETELGEGPRNPILTQFIQDEFKWHKDGGLNRQTPRTDVGELNGISHQAIKETWGTKFS